MNTISRWGGVRTLCRTLLLVPVVLLGACGGGGDAGVVTADDAKTVAQDSRQSTLAASDTSAASAILPTLATNTQDLISDNLRRNRVSSEVYFTGNWCKDFGARRTDPDVLGSRPLRSCSHRRNAAPDFYFYQPVMEAGTYEVYTRWTAVSPRSNAVEVIVNYSELITNSSGIDIPTNLTQTFVVNQSVSSNGWFYLGTFSSLGGSRAIGVSIKGSLAIPAGTDGARFFRL